MLVSVSEIDKEQLKQSTTRPPEVLYGVHQEIKLSVSVFLKLLHGFTIVNLCLFLVCLICILFTYCESM